MAGMTYKTVVTPEHNAASVAAGSDIIAPVLLNVSGMLMVFVALDTSTTVQLGVSDGTTTEKFDLNDGTALKATTGYAFTWPAFQGFSYSLVNKTGATASTVQHAAFMLESPVG